jgi:hypothetical protein
MERRRQALVAVAGSLLLLGSTGAIAGGKDMSFFVTSVGMGDGANLGGLEGADRHCHELATAAGAGKHTWRAYLSTQGSKLDDASAVHARDRIGKGPWYNAKGVMIAKNVEELHSAKSKLTKEAALDEKGQMVNGRTEKPNRHDVLTGSRPDGTAFPPNPPFQDMTCGNWTKNGEEGSAMLGHHDHAGTIPHPWATSWNSSHPTRGGCNQTALQSTGGDGLFYCFAEK